ncbi:MAG: 50S ribosomal protein L15 [Candidatus Obscuribacterales bacterium]
MRLEDLRPADGARRNKKRVGRGRGSGHGKTSTRGHNGQGQRSGESRRFGFEGGQTPLFRRLPKIHNFDQVINRDWVEVNVGQLNALPANTEVTAESLVEHNVLRSATDSLRILGNGELKVALKVRAHHISAGAKEKIEKAGGAVELIGLAPPTKGKKQAKVKNPATRPVEPKAEAPKADKGEGKKEKEGKGDKKDAGAAPKGEAKEPKAEGKKEKPEAKKDDKK